MKHYQLILCTVISALAFSAQVSLAKTIDSESAKIPAPKSVHAEKAKNPANKKTDKAIIFQNKGEEEISGGSQTSKKTDKAIIFQTQGQ